ncbi:hypothetical protein [Pleionea litopenaei]|uniref:Uncharacterized protein n=1 Tax=Pleionea litopenaei TaxID=3070815 RepID=A0AA51RWP9_9GAMM|nr:hypothetical protein [Pleionea sp. HL-JVS1]WMS88894.1 hypothetical protein Q9312_08245 [Pleionea sp. HL-JVS1]
MNKTTCGIEEQAKDDNVDGTLIKAFERSFDVTANVKEDNPKALNSDSLFANTKHLTWLAYQYHLSLEHYAGIVLEQTIRSNEGTFKSFNVTADKFEQQYKNLWRK